MKKYSIYYCTKLVALLFAATACSDDSDNSLEDWKVANQMALNATKVNSEYSELKSSGNEGSIYYKVLKKGNGKDSIYYTSQVELYLKGWFIAPYENYKITDGTEFQHWLFDNGMPYLTTISTSTYLLRGLKVALQNMLEGDKWEIWVPYQLGTGSQETEIPYDIGRSSPQLKVNVPPYSVLVYELEVVKVRKN